MLYRFSKKKKDYKELLGKKGEDNHIWNKKIKIELHSFS